VDGYRFVLKGGREIAVCAPPIADDQHSDRSPERRVARADPVRTVGDGNAEPDHRNGISRRRSLAGQVTFRQRISPVFRLTT
jgi:hypothetical protein